MLKDNELCNITGGAVKWTVGVIIGTIFTFLAGVVDGYLRPLKCNK